VAFNITNNQGDLMISVKVWLVQERLKERFAAAFGGVPDGGNAGARAVIGATITAIVAIVGWLVAHVHFVK
jgi:hypothetical protein